MRKPTFDEPKCPTIVSMRERRQTIVMRARSRMIAAAAIALLAFVLAPASALATSSDDTATHTYILANYALVRASEAKVGVGQTDFKSYFKQINGKCKGAGAGAPQDEEAQPLNYEATGALWSITYGVDAAPIRTFVSTVDRLHWSNSKLTQIAKSYAATLHGLATLPLPDLCGDVQTWRAGGFRTVPASTTSFDRHVESLEAQTIPPKLLARYEQPGDRSIVERTTSLELKLQDVETSTGYNDLESLLDTLGLHL
jgi:hypothetical protein